MEDWSAKDVPEKPELATLTVVPKIVNGHHIHHGVSAINHVAEVPKIEHAPYNSLHSIMEESVSEMELNSEIAISTRAQLTADGVFGANGSYALKHAEEACKLGHEESRNRKDMEEKLVLVTRLR